MCVQLQTPGGPDEQPGLKTTVSHSVPASCQEGAREILTSTLVAVGSPCWKDPREHITPAPHLLGSWGYRSPPAHVTVACHKLWLISKRGNQEGRMLNPIGPGVPRRAGTSLTALLPVVQRISPLQASGPPAQAPLCATPRGNPGQAVQV